MSDTVLPSGHILGAETGTPFGWHYYAAYRECPRSFYYRHVLGLEPDREKPAVRSGRIFHTLKEAFYTGTTDFDALKVLLRRLVDEAEADGVYGEFDPPQEAYTVLEAAFANWVLKYGATDLETWDILGVELPFDETFKCEEGPVRLTGRLDLAARRKFDGLLLLVDTKTSGSTGPEKLGQGANLGDQLTVYSLAMEQLYGEVPTAIVDGALLKGRNPQVGRTELYRTADEIWDCIVGLVHTAHDIGRSALYMQTLQTTWHYAYPRHTQKCSLWGCPYEAFCRSGLGPNEVPPGFHKVAPRG